MFTHESRQAVQRHRECSPMITHERQQQTVQYAPEHGEELCAAQDTLRA